MKKNGWRTAILQPQRYYLLQLIFSFSLLLLSSWPASSLLLLSS
jgi:hypothetical protein